MKRKKNFVFDDGVYSNGYTNKVYKVRKMILNRVNKRGETKVYIEVTDYEYHSKNDYKKEFKRISTDIWIEPKFWNSKKQEVSVNAPDSYKKNLEIEKKFTEVRKAINDATSYNDSPYYSGFSPKWLTDLFPQLKRSKKGLVDYLEDYWKLRKDQNTPHGTLKEFRTLINRIIAFEKWKGQKTLLEDINLLWSDDFEIFLKNYAYNGIGYKEGTVEKTYTILITVLNYYYELKDELYTGITDKFKSRKFKRGRKSVNEPNPLTYDQLKILSKHDFKNDSLNKTKERFMFQCFSGLRYSDMDKIRPDNIKEGDILRYKPKKTSRYDKIIIQPINDKLKSILEKYNYDTSALKVANQDYNRKLKEMFGILKQEYPSLNFKNNYTTHNGRDTFISLAVKRGVNFKTILIWVGQSSYKIMDRYIGLDIEFQVDEMKRLYGDFK